LSFNLHLLTPFLMWQSLSLMGMIFRA